VVCYGKSKEIEIIFDTDIEEKIMGFDHDMIIKRKILGQEWKV